MHKEAGFDVDDAPTLALPSSWPAPTRAHAEELVGSRVDRYQLVQLIGEGGFGRVYLAEQQEPVRRKVALKIIKLGMDTRQVIARFDAERQALAMMDHPNIARVLDAGATPNGRPFFVMELVHGIPITEFCDRNQLRNRERLELFIDVCRAIQHAHQKGVIHRDLKPNNVLVTLHDGRPVAKVIDFGIAKATSAELTDLTLVTEFRHFIGTPEYMSPEQAEMSGLDTDARADIYSLGVLLYELLTGTQPFDPNRFRQGGLHAIQRIICEEEPQKPSTRMSSLLSLGANGNSSTADSRNLTERARAIAASRRCDPAHLSRELRGDLDWIVMKCLEKDRTRRYVTANDLAEDLTRHLNSRPVLAGPPTLSYRIRKLARRHRMALAVAVTFTLAVGAAMSTGIVQWRQATLAKRSAEAGWAEANVQRERAETALEEAEQASQFLVDMLGASDPEERGRAVTVAEMLDDAAQNVATRFPDSPLIEARLRYTIGTTYMALGNLLAAERQLQGAFEIRREHLGRMHEATLIATSALAQLYAAQGRLAESEELQLDALEIVREVHGERHERTVGILNNLAWLQISLGRLSDAGESIDAALSAANAVLPPDHLYRLKALGTRASLLVQAGRVTEGIADFELLLELQNRALSPNHPDTLATLMNIANAYMALSDYRTAESMYAELLPRYEQVHGENAPDTLNLQVNLANVLAKLGEYEPAAALAHETYQELFRQVGPGHRSTMEAAGVASIVLAAQGKDEQAEEILRNLLAELERNLGPLHGRTLQARSSLIEFLRSRGRDDDIDALAARHIQFLLDAANRTDASAHTLNLAAWELLTIGQESLRNPPAALGFARRACDIQERDPYLLDTLGLAQHQNGLHGEAIATLALALELLPAADPNRHEVERHLNDAERALADASGTPPDGWDG